MLPRLGVVSKCYQIKIAMTSLSHLAQYTTPPPTNWKTKTDYTISSKDTSVRVQGTNAEIEAWKPENAFRHINDDDEGIQCKGVSYGIGSNCSIRFDDCLFAAHENVDGMNKGLIEAVRPAVADTRVKKKGHYNGKCPPGGGPCEPGYDFEYGQYTYLETGSVLVSVYPEGRGQSDCPSEDPLDYLLFESRVLWVLLRRESRLYILLMGVLESAYSYTDSDATRRLVKGGMR